MFGDILKELRNSKGLLQEELGKIIGISKSTVGMYETGKRMPNDKTLKKISAYFGVTIDYLFGIEQEKLLIRKEKILLNEREEELILAIRNKKDIAEMLKSITEYLQSQG